MTILEWLEQNFTKFATYVKNWANGKFALKTDIPNLEKYFNADPKYNSESKKIEFYHDSTKVAELDATAFIKDGMVNTVSITDGKTGGENSGKKVLLITFNTDSGKEDIEIPLANIFDANNYYNKTEADNKFVKVEDLTLIDDAKFQAMFNEA